MADPGRIRENPSAVDTLAEAVKTNTEAIVTLTKGMMLLAERLQTLEVAQTESPDAPEENGDAQCTCPAHPAISKARMQEFGQLAGWAIQRVVKAFAEELLTREQLERLELGTTASRLDDVLKGEHATLEGLLRDCFTAGFHESAQRGGEPESD